MAIKEGQSLKKIKFLIKTLLIMMVKRKRSNSNKPHK